jgi:hypothetical protein
MAGASLWLAVKGFRWYWRSAVPPHPRRRFLQTTFQRTIQRIEFRTGFIRLIFSKPGYQQQRPGGTHRIDPDHFRVQGKRVSHARSRQPFQRRLTAAVTLRVQLCAKALQQTGQQFKSFSQPLLAFAVQLRPAVVGRDTDIFGGRGQASLRRQMSSVSAPESLLTSSRICWKSSS